MDVALCQEILFRRFSSRFPWYKIRLIDLKETFLTRVIDYPFSVCTKLHRNLGILESLDYGGVMLLTVYNHIVEIDKNNNLFVMESFYWYIYWESIILS